MKKILFLLLGSICFYSFGQPQATPSSQVVSALQQKKQMKEQSLVQHLPFRNVGPTIMSGRVTDLAVNPKDPTEFYVGYASGGVWHTNNNGTSFTPILDSSPTQNVGTLAVDWSTNTIWVGTGEVNASRSSYAGIGLLKSENQGKTWTNMGLRDSHHISKILINPSNTKEIVVGVIGRLYSKNEERGIFKTFDGGKTWNKTLYVDDQTGIIEMDVDPSNFNIMYASAWDKDRKAWNFRGNGSKSGIYRSRDGGSTWTQVSTPQSGFPTGDGVGRIGIAVVDENTVYAIHDNQFRRTAEEEQKEQTGLTKDDFKSMNFDAFLNLDDKKLNTFLRENRFPRKYSAKQVKSMVKNKEALPKDLAIYLEDANTLLFDTPVIGAEVYKSTNGGKTWKKTHKGYLDDIYYSYGYYFGKIHVSPVNKNSIYIYGVPILKSKDGGKTFSSISAQNVHGDHHALWINPKNPSHLINGNDGGVNITYDDGENWIKCNTPAVGQFYTVNVDQAEPYNVYGGLQDNGVWMGANTYEESVGWHQSGQYPYKFIMGGDGMQVQIDSRNNDVVYTGYQFGNYYRLNLKTEETKYIQPKHELGESPYRFNWQTPILLSKHNEDILYLGGNKLMRSLNQGDDWEAISPDLTQGGKQGNVAYGTITSISESPFQFGLLYTGSDDGLVYISKNAGANWEKISDSFPKDLWVSRVIASAHKKSRVYVALNGYRWDDFNTYLYKSEDYGKTWKKISAGIPSSPINVIKEDPENEAILYVGTDNGLYTTLNQGSSWELFSNGLPNVAFHDLVVHPKAKDLVIGTHGRSFYIADVSLLQQLNEKNLNAVVVNEIQSIRHSPRWGSSFSSWGDPYEPEINLHFYNPKDGSITIQITTEDGTVLKQWNKSFSKGIHSESYNLTMNKKGVKSLEDAGITIEEAQNGMYYLPKGKFKIDVKNGTLNTSTMLEIK